MDTVAYSTINLPRTVTELFQKKKAGGEYCTDGLRKVNTHGCTVDSACVCVMLFKVMGVKQGKAEG